MRRVDGTSPDWRIGGGLRPPGNPARWGLNGAIHWIIANVNAPWAELFMPAPGGPKEVYRMWEEQYQITRGPEGVYTRPSEQPGFGWDIEVVS